MKLHDATFKLFSLNIELYTCKIELNVDDLKPFHPSSKFYSRLRKLYWDKPKQKILNLKLYNHNFKRYKYTRKPRKILLKPLATPFERLGQAHRL